MMMEVEGLGAGGNGSDFSDEDEAPPRKKAPAKKPSAAPAKRAAPAKKATAKTTKGKGKKIVASAAFVKKGHTN